MGKRIRCDFGFSEDMPEDEDGLAFEIRRVPTSGKVKGVILSDGLVCRQTHWWGGRTVPCSDVGCAPCAENTERRWHGWVALYSLERQTTVIIELTAKSIKPLREWRKDFGTLRGAELTLGRVGKKINGRVFASLARGPVAVDLLPSSPDVQLLLLKLWGLEPGLPGLGIAVAKLHSVNGHGGIE